MKTFKNSRPNELWSKRFRRWLPPRVNVLIYNLLCLFVLEHLRVAWLCLLPNICRILENHISLLLKAIISDCSHSPRWRSDVERVTWKVTRSRGQLCLRCVVKLDFYCKFKHLFDFLRTRKISDHHAFSMSPADLDVRWLVVRRYLGAKADRIAFHSRRYQLYH